MVNSCRSGPSELDGLSGELTAPDGMNLEGRNPLSSCPSGLSGLAGLGWRPSGQGCAGLGLGRQGQPATTLQGRNPCISCGYGPSELGGVGWGADWAGWHESPRTESIDLGRFWSFWTGLDWLVWVGD